MFWLGLLVGYVWAIICALHEEKEYLKTGIAKIYGKYYKITPYEKEN